MKSVSILVLILIVSVPLNKARPQKFWKYVQSQNRAQHHGAYAATPGNFYKTYGHDRENNGKMAIPGDHTHKECAEFTGSWRKAISDMQVNYGWCVTLYASDRCRGPRA